MRFTVVVNHRVCAHRLSLRAAESLAAWYAAAVPGSVVRVGWR